jgi:hypothetical protein
MKLKKVVFVSSTVKLVRTAKTEVGMRKASGKNRADGRPSGDMGETREKQ